MALYRGERGYSVAEVVELLNDALKLLLDLREVGFKLTPVHETPPTVMVSAGSVESQRRLDCLTRLKANNGKVPLTAAQMVVSKESLQSWVNDARFVRELGSVLCYLCQEPRRNLREFWSVREVNYVCRRDGIVPQKRRTPEGAGTPAERLARWRLGRVFEAGWSHLVPAEGSELKEGQLHLSPREAEVLALLRENGAMTAQQLTEGLKRKQSILCAGDRLLLNLVDSGLVEMFLVERVGSHGRPRKVFRLSDKLKFHERSKQPDGIELAAKHRKLQSAKTDASDIPNEDDQIADFGDEDE